MNTSALLLCLIFAVCNPLVSALPIAKKSGSINLVKSNYAVPRDFPGVPFQVPQSYAGLLPVSDRPDETGQLFFWYYPRTSDAGEDDLVIWLNGGPGCSSLTGALTENGPWLLDQFGEAHENPYSWTNLSNIVFIEQPVGTGFTTGTPTADDETDNATQFIGFLDHFYSLFPELQGKNLWITGESYAGKYIPYIASGIYSLPAQEASDRGINLKGIQLIDPSFTQDVAGFGEDLVAVDYAVQNQQQLNLSDAVMAVLLDDAYANGIYNFTQQHLSYPPQGHIYPPKEYSSNYAPWNDVYLATNASRACFDIYDISQDCPLPRDPLGFDGVTQTFDPDNWINTTPGVKDALNVDESRVWTACSNEPVFVGNAPRGDGSLPPDVTVLPGVIEQSERSIIAHGDKDFILISQGSALAIQNMTWNGLQGFQERPTAELKVDGQALGTVHTERGLTFATVAESGHMLPADSPAAAYKLMQYLLGQIDSLED